MRPDRRLIVFARAPVAGRVKTRLGEVLSPRARAALHRAFLLDVLELALRVPGVDVTLAYTPRGAGRVMRALAAQAAVPGGTVRARVALQKGADLGARMTGALADAFASGAKAAVVIGTDSPTLPPARLVAAFHALARADLVLGPARDGGYYLIGSRRALPDGLLDGIAWSSGGERAQTLRRARAAGLRTAQLSPWHDVDRPRDLERLRRELAGPRGDGRHGTARHTRAALLRLFPLEPTRRAGV